MHVGAVPSSLPHHKMHARSAKVIQDGLRTTIHRYEHRLDIEFLRARAVGIQARGALTVGFGQTRGALAVGFGVGLGSSPVARI